MRVGVIRTGGLPSVRTGAGAIEPRLDVASFSDPPASAFGIALNRIISAFRVLRPIERKAIANKPFAEVGAADQTGCNRAAIWVEAARQAINRTTSDEAVEVVCCLRATAILQTVLAAAQLAALRRVDAPRAPARMGQSASRGRSIRAMVAPPATAVLGSRARRTPDASAPAPQRRSRKQRTEDRAEPAVGHGDSHAGAPHRHPVVAGRHPVERQGRGADEEADGEAREGGGQEA